jgi:hypothetical protein
MEYFFSAIKISQKGLPQLPSFAPPAFGGVINNQLTPKIGEALKGLTP